MNLRILFLSLCITPLISHAASKDRGGGDQYAIEFIETAERLKPWILNNQKFLGISGDDFEKALNEAVVESTTQNLEIDGMQKDAINYPSDKKIVFSRSAWERPSAKDFRNAFVFHEYLGIMRVNDSNYKISRILSKLAIVNWQNEFVVTIVKYIKLNVENFDVPVGINSNEQPNIAINEYDELALLKDFKPISITKMTSDMIQTLQQATYNCPMHYIFNKKTIKLTNLIPSCSENEF